MMQPAIRILVVDDESAIRRALRPPLMELGFQVAEAARGRRGAARCCAAPPTMPCCSTSTCRASAGIETLRRIRTFAPRLPVLMLTVRDEEEDKVQALETGRRRLRDQALQHAGADRTHPQRSAARTRPGTA